MRFKVLGKIVEMNMTVLKDTMMFFGIKLKTKNNDIIRGKWLKK
jgi:hypothetical protein